jgi:hypothetical protein
LGSKVVFIQRAISDLEKINIAVIGVLEAEVVVKGKC